MDEAEVPLHEIYAEALAACDPARLVAERLIRRPELRDWPAILLGKCAARFAEGLRDGGWRGRGIAAVPAGYERELARTAIETVIGSHPEIDARSFRAGAAVLAFARSLDEPTLVLLSGGASATAEAALEPHLVPERIVRINRLLVRSGLPIAAINTVRKHLSAIKGGRLGQLLNRGSEGWILSDVVPGQPEMVGSGPVCGDPTSNGDAAAILDALEDAEASDLAALLRDGAIPDTPARIDLVIDVLADNRSLTRAAATAARRRTISTNLLPESMDGDVEDVAVRLAGKVADAAPGALVIAGGEPTVRVRGEGRGGRCSELALRLLRIAMRDALPRFSAIVASSDGLDGNSGAAGYVLRWTGTPPMAEAAISIALDRSDAHGIAAAAGEVLPGGATGNNLRDIMLMART